MKVTDEEGQWNLSKSLHINPIHISTYLNKNLLQEIMQHSVNVKVWKIIYTRKTLNFLNIYICVDLDAFAIMLLKISEFFFTTIHA